MKTIDYERYIFRLIFQEPGEKFDSFIERLKIQLRKCNFDDRESSFKDQIIEKCANDELRSKAFENRMTLDQLIYTGRVLEEAGKNCLGNSTVKDKFDEEELMMNKTYESSRPIQDALTNLNSYAYDRFLLAQVKNRSYEESYQYRSKIGEFNEGKTSEGEKIETIISIRKASNFDEEIENIKQQNW